MKVIKIKKVWSAGSTEHYLIVPKLYDIEDIDYAVEDWCANDSGGQGNGYSFSWSEVIDEKIIKEQINSKLKVLSNQISALLTEQRKLLTFLEIN